MNKLLLFSMALMMSLVLASGFGIAGQSVFAQNYGYEDDYPDDRYSYSDDRYGNHDNFKKFKFDFYVVTKESGTGTLGNPLEATAACDRNDEVTGGGFLVNADPEEVEVEITSSVPNENFMGKEAWKATGFVAELEMGAEAPTLTAYAVCFDNKGSQYNSDGFD